MSRKRKAGKALYGRFTAMPRYILDCAAYNALPPLARCIYWHLHRMAGMAGEKNGGLFYSVRNAAEDHAVAPNTIMKAFDQLQTKGFILGFILPERIGHPGLEGHGKATTWRLTHFPIVVNKLPTRDFEKWSEGNDLPVAKKQKPVSKTATLRTFQVPSLYQPLRHIKSYHPPQADHWRALSKEAAMRDRALPPSPYHSRLEGSMMKPHSLHWNGGKPSQSQPPALTWALAP